MHVHLWIAAALQHCEGPGGGKEKEPDTSDAVAIEFQNNAVVEENNFTDLGKWEKNWKDSWCAQKYIEKQMQSRLSWTYRIPISAYYYPPDVIIT